MGVGGCGRIQTAGAVPPQVDGHLVEARLADAVGEGGQQVRLQEPAHLRGLDLDAGQAVVVAHPELPEALLVEHLLRRLDAPEPTPADAPAVQLLSSVLRDVRGIEADTRGIGGSTVAAHFRRHGYPAVVWSTVNATMHQANENCEIANMVADARVFAGLFSRNTEDDYGD